MIGQPEVTFDDNCCTVLWQDEGVGFAFESLQERRDGLHADLEVQAIVPGREKPGHIHWARLNLASTSGREGLLKACFKKTSDDGGKTSRYDWEDLIEYACTITAKKFREGEPIINLAELPRPDKFGYLVEKIMPKGQTSAIFSRGASGKSLLAMAIAMAVSEGYNLPSGLKVTSTEKVLYLDYETDAEEQRLRLDYLWKARKGSALPNIFYRRQLRALADDIAFIKAEVKRLNIGLVVVDSIAYAMAGKAMDPEVAIQTFNALRSLGPAVTRLVIAHIPKADKEQKESSIFGSVFQENAARSIWEMRSTEMQDGIAIGLFMRKKNWGKGFDPIGLRFTFDDLNEAVMLHHFVIADDPELASHSTLTFRLVSALRSGSKSERELTDETGGTSETIRRTLTRLEARGEIVRIGTNGTSRGSDRTWGLAYEERF